MAINYPIITQTIVTSSAGPTGPGYFNYAVGMFTNDGQIVTGSTYTISVSASAYLFAVSGDVASGSTISIQMPTSSLIQAGSGNVKFYSPAVEFWRVDSNPVTVKLIGDSGSSVFFGKPFGGTSDYTLPTSSYTNITQLDLGGMLVYLPLEQSTI